MMEYKDLAVSQQMHKAIERMGFTQMTEIQEKAIPVMLEGREIIAKAPTGTGKTCAFGIPIVEKVEADKPWLQALVLCPTRELCTQICDDLRNLAYFKEGVRVVAVYGGQPMGKQLSALKNRPQIVVATPGRLLDHMARKTIRLDKVCLLYTSHGAEPVCTGAPGYPGKDLCFSGSAGGKDPGAVGCHPGQPL